MKKAEVMAEPDPASSHFGRFLRRQLPFVWDAPVSCPTPLCFLFCMIKTRLCINKPPPHTGTPGFGLQLCPGNNSEVFSGCQTRVQTCGERAGTGRPSALWLSGGGRRTAALPCR